MPDTRSARTPVAQGIRHLESGIWNLESVARVG